MEVSGFHRATVFHLAPTRVSVSAGFIAIWVLPAGFRRPHPWRRGTALPIGFHLPRGPRSSSMEHHHNRKPRRLRSALPRQFCCSRNRVSGSSGDFFPAPCCFSSARRESSGARAYEALFGGIARRALRRPVLAEQTAPPVRPARREIAIPWSAVSGQARGGRRARTHPLQCSS